MPRKLMPLLVTSFVIVICSHACGQGGLGEADTNDDQKVDATDSATQTETRQRAARQRSTGLRVGETAPTFKLKSLDGKSETDLADFKGNKPVVLIFGSYT